MQISKIKLEYVLILVIVAFILYHLSRCRCFNEGFSISGKDIGDNCFNDDDCNDNLGWNNSCNKNCSCKTLPETGEDICVSKNMCVQENCKDHEFCHNDGTCKEMVTKELLESEEFDDAEPYPTPPDFMALRPWLQQQPLGSRAEATQELTTQLDKFVMVINKYVNESTALADLIQMLDAEKKGDGRLKEMIVEMGLDEGSGEDFRNAIEGIPEVLIDKVYSLMRSLPQDWPETYVENITISGGYGYRFDKSIAGKGVFKLYHIKFDDPPYEKYFQSGKKFIEVVNTYSMSGNSASTYAVPIVSIKEGTNNFYLTEDTGSGEIIRSRASISRPHGGGLPNFLNYFSTVPIGYGYGEKLMFLLSDARKRNPEYSNIQITDFNPDTGTKKAYRNLFRLSVGPTWPKKTDEPFSIFKPSNSLMQKLYNSSVTSVFFNINQDVQNDNFNLFLMSLSEKEGIYLRNLDPSNTEKNIELRKKYILSLLPKDRTANDNTFIESQQQ